MFLRLTELGEGVEDTRRRVPIDELVPEGASRGEPSRPARAASPSARLVTLGEGTAEVAHEVLIREWPTLRGWLDEDREGLRLHRRLGDAARALGGRRAGAHATSTAAPGSAPRSSGRSGHREELNAAERAFLDASVAESERDAERSCGPTAACAACSPAPACCSSPRRWRACWRSGRAATRATPPGPPTPSGSALRR